MSLASHFRSQKNTSGYLNGEKNSNQRTKAIGITKIDWGWIK
jgi:hypothetical protein